MLIFSSQYNDKNLKDAANCSGIPVSHLQFIETREMSLNDILWMWTTQSVYSIEEENGLKFAWGKDLEFEDVIDYLENKYEAKFVKVKNNIDPIIVIDGHLYDGWKRAILAYSLGQLFVACSIFHSMKITKPYLFATNPLFFDKIKEFIECNKINSVTENHDGGILFYFESEEAKALVSSQFGDNI